MRRVVSIHIDPRRIDERYPHQAARLQYLFQSTSIREGSMNAIDSYLKEG